jgi:hypothetical protein
MMLISSRPFRLLLDRSALLGVALFAASGCGGGAKVGGAACQLLPGDLVITEIMADPGGDENKGEWIEVYNASDRPAALNQLALSVSSGGNPKTHTVVGAPPLAAHAYFTLGNGPTTQSFVGYSYGGAIDLSNSGATITLTCKGQMVDTVSYGSLAKASPPTATRSLSFDGGILPDHLRNDEARLWCDSAGVPYDGTNYGTPGAANAPCGIASCSDSGTTRAVTPPAEGGLVVSEVFANPSGDDAGKEWLELYVSSPTAVDLNGVSVEVGTAAGGTPQAYKLTSLDCLVAEPGQRLVVGASKDVAANGHVPVDVVAQDFSLPNDALVVRLLAGSTVIDVAQVPAAVDGVAQRLDDARLTSTGDDTTTAYCNATQVGLFDGTGSPGKPNGFCGVLACKEGASTRDVESAKEGDLIITEVLAHPKGSSEAGKEWLELYVSAAGNLDLNGLTLVTATPDGKSPKTFSIASETCLTATPGSYLLIGASSDPLVNGGITVQAVVANLSIPNTAQSLTLLAGDVVVDTAMVPAASAEGTAVMLDESRRTADGNDSADSWCAALSASSLFDGVGTPGADNGLCGTFACRDGGSVRAPMPPASGDLVINEIMADATGADTGKEWLELYVAGAASVDLNNLIIVDTKENPVGSRSATVRSEDCLKAAPGSYVVIASSADPASNGGIEGAIAAPDLSFFDAVALTVDILLGDTVLDEAKVDVTKAGKSWSLDPEKRTVADNDNPLSFCLATRGPLGSVPGCNGATYADTGTPGEANQQCGQACFEGCVERKAV